MILTPSQGFGSWLRFKLLESAHEFSAGSQGVFSHVVKPGIWVMSFPEHLANLNRDSGSSNMQVRIFLENQRVRRRVDVVCIPIS